MFRFKLYPTKKKRIQCSLQNYNQIRIVDKIFILERNLFSVIDKYLGLLYCMRNLFFFDCIYLLWALILIHSLRKGSVVHLYQHMVYAFCAFHWGFYAWIVKNRVWKIAWTNILQKVEVSSIWKQCTALLALMQLLAALSYNRCEQQIGFLFFFFIYLFFFFHYLRHHRR